MRFTEYSPCPETQNKMASSSKGVEVMVCGLDHSGSQPFKYMYMCMLGGLVFVVDESHYHNHSGAH